MTDARLAHLWRHPVKGIGSEALTSADLSPAGAVAGDRAWALLNNAAPDTDDWQPRRNFLQVASGPDLSQVSARSETDGHIVLTHPDRPALRFDPDTEAQLLADWAAPLWPEDRPPPGRLVRAPGHGMTDMAAPFVSVGNLASLRALSDKAGQPLDMRRFRINLWLGGLDPWVETGWIGQGLRVGGVALTVDQPIGRCRAPEANPATGQRDVNVLRLLEDNWGHTDLGVYVRVQAPGKVSVGDPVVTP